MSYRLELDDIQGNIVRAYGRYSFPFARYYFFNISDDKAGRTFVGQVARRVTTAKRWQTDAERPKCTVNIGFNFLGLMHLRLPNRTLQRMPEEFISGMKERAFLLGDRDQTVTEDAVSTEAGVAQWDAHWDPIWQANRRGDGYGADNVHIWVSLNAQLKTPFTMDPVDELEQTAGWLKALCDASNGGVTLLAGHGRNGEMDHHAASAVFEKHGNRYLPTPCEYFGFADGIGDPVFKGQYPEAHEADAVQGRGKRVGKRWEPLEAGEFILGYPDESQELPPAAAPVEFMRNGSFMAYRKLHENVGSFHEVVKTEAERFARVRGIPVEEADITLRAKMCGRWPDGLPMAKFPDFRTWQAARKALDLDDPDRAVALERQIKYIRSKDASDFRYADDMLGYRTAPGAHLRRMNTRDYLDPLNKVGIDPKTGEQALNENAIAALNARRRILRRGLPYGPPPGTDLNDETEQGVTMMIVGASLFRQFEFVQQQWIQYGLDFHQGNDTCPMLGNHEAHRRFAIPADPKSGDCPYVMSGLKTFVECRGGDYFFIPSMTALRMIAMGVVDPT